MSLGEQLRDFLPVSVVAEYLVEIGLNAPGCGIVNVCSAQPKSIRSLVENWIEERGWKMSLELGHCPYPDYEPMAFWGSDLRLRNLLTQRS
jgi:hypothetical protein